MKNVILIILVIYTGMVKAQPAIDLINLFDHGGGSPELFVDVYLTDQGDYLACGQSGESPWIIRIDYDGNQIWDYQADVGGRLF
jgi:hypothetical protein